MKLNIVADSSINLFSPREEMKDVSFSTVPFIISVGTKDYVDDENIDVEVLMEDMVTNKAASRTACPNTLLWYDEFKKEGDVIAITISSNLSGSINSALAAKQMVLAEEPNKKIGIIDSRSTGPAMELILDMINECMEKGMNAEEAADEINAKILSIKTIFTLCSFDNLVKNGRMNKIAGFVAGKLHLWGVGIASDEGTIKIKGLAFGTKGVLKSIVEDITNRLSDVSKVVIHHAKNIVTATKVKDKILEAFPKVKVFLSECRGLCSYYAEKNGLIVSYM